MAKNACDRETIDRQVEKERDIAERIAAAMDPRSDRLEKDLAKLECMTGNDKGKTKASGKGKSKGGVGREVARPDTTPR